MIFTAFSLLFAERRSRYFPNGRVLIHDSRKTFNLITGKRKKRRKKNMKEKFYDNCSQLSESDEQKSRDSR